MMTQLRHFDHDGRVRFVTFSCHKRLPLLTNNRFRSIITRWLAAAREEHGFKLLGYVIMPEHVHIVIWPPEGSAVGTIVGRIKQESAKEILRILDSVSSPLLGKLTITRNGEIKRAFWQRRCYDHNCRGANSVWEKIEYCHKNPVKRGMVRDPSRWTYSSHNWYQGDRDVPLQMDEPVQIKLTKPTLRVGHLNSGKRPGALYA